MKLNVALLSRAYPPSREPQVKDFGSYPDVVEAAAPDGVPGLKKAIWLN